MLTLDHLRRRAAAPTATTAFRTPCVAVHTEDSQVPRFVDRAVGLTVDSEPAVVVRAVAPPLIYIQIQSQDTNANNAVNANTALRLAAERAFGQGRIAAHRVYQLDACCADPQWIPSSALVRAAAFDGPLVLRVVAFPRVLQPRMAALLAAHGVTTHPTQFSHELHVTMQPSVSNLFFFGLVRRGRPPADESIVRGPSTRAEAPCRAFFKLDECLRNHHVRLDVGARVLHVGSSPGGWTDCLLRHGAAVVAVDPGELTIPVAGRAVIHIQSLLEGALEQLQQMDKFAMAVCDINVRVGAMAALMLRVAPLLERGASVVFTLKLGKKPTRRAVDEAFAQARSILASEFRSFRLEWLHANTQNERMLIAIKR